MFLWSHIYNFFIFSLIFLTHEKMTTTVQGWRSHLYVFSHAYDSLLSMLQTFGWCLFYRILKVQFYKMKISISLLLESRLSKYNLDFALGRYLSCNMWYMNISKACTLIVSISKYYMRLQSTGLECCTNWSRTQGSGRGVGIDLSDVKGFAF